MKMNKITVHARKPMTIGAYIDSIGADICGEIFTHADYEGFYCLISYSSDAATFVVFSTDKAPRVRGHRLDEEFTRITTPVTITFNVEDD